MERKDIEVIDTICQCIKDMVCMTPSGGSEFIQTRLKNVFDRVDRLQDQLRDEMRLGT